MVYSPYSAGADRYKIHSIYIDPEPFYVNAKHGKNLQTFMASGRHHLPADRPEAGTDFLARHASEQYFTSAQFFAQLLRHVISRPQVTHILLGSPALLPLKPDFWGIVVRFQFNVLW